MLAEKVCVEIFGELSENFYSGYVNNEKFNNKKAYIITKKETDIFFKGIVIAIATFDNEEKLIVSSEDEVFYEPDLRIALDKLRNINLVSLKCLYEKSCGGIIFYKGKNNTKILLVKNNNGRYWSFPKGHIEIGETEEQTAIREIKEETGLDVELKGDFKEVSDYCPFGKIRKRVVFFLAQAYTDNVVMQEEEIAEYIWVDLQQAHKVCSYDNDLRIVEKATSAIKLLK